MADIDFSNLDVEKILGSINSTDPMAVLTSLGMPPEDAGKALIGDYSSIGSNLEKPQELDFDVIMSNYGKLFNRKLIEYFFLKAKLSEPFTEEETEAYREVYGRWFDFVFRIGVFNIYLFDETEPDSRCVSIKVNEDHYSMISLHNHYFILKLNL